MKILLALYDVIISWIKEIVVSLFFDKTRISLYEINSYLAQAKRIPIFGENRRDPDHPTITGIWKYKNGYFYVRLLEKGNDEIVEVYNLRGSKTIQNLIDEIKEKRKNQFMLWSVRAESEDESRCIGKQIEKERKGKHSIVLGKEKIDIIRHIKWTLNQEKIPQTFNLLISGPPGCGKSSLVLEICRRCRITELLSINPGELNSGQFKHAIKTFKDRNTKSCILIEDLDRVYEGDKPINPKGVDFSTLLNELSGVGDNNGILFCVTVNHPDRLDSALLGEDREEDGETFQSGRRFNYHLKVGMPTQEELHKIAVNILGKDFPSLEKILKKGKNDSFKKFTDRCQWELGEHILNKQVNQMDAEDPSLEEDST